MKRNGSKFWEIFLIKPEKSSKNYYIISEKKV